MTKPDAPTVYTKDAPTVMKGRLYNLAVNSELTFKGGSPPRHRRQIIITCYGAVAPSTSTTMWVHIRTQPTGLYTAGTEPEDGHAITLWGKSSISLFTNSDVVVRNTHDTLKVSIAVAEIFYE